MVKAKRDLINSVVILAFSGFAYYGSSLISERNLGKTEADFFPNIMIGVIAFLSLCLLANSIVRMKKEKDSHLNISIRKLLQENKKVILTFILFGLYVLLLGYIGYFPSSILFLITLYLVLATNKQKMWIVCLGFIALTLVLYIVFQNALSVFLPTGVFF
ncbi:tripartite tricarboxylate transporter TctB family protein [Aquibacillus sp. 3ASR75-11]|uniref:Tripartite tricarboxylate transporter TctB family protein n=1 Tax=Terrihalobacillus insolitus TaxID=2950438 RepID=A0A9X3WP34_9BACI|nr:tripartite tricarboxylate transporter TctB family protein [Terrihalobacillus insolitus]MDC3412077.1 tripartite tricarboxylate transporter TctB family protein [Terrihalobacillus insolitus]MDC3423230.1 tripartite tricarboxylate transporter TctB family protein [Terrihalobacillus insolitus]